VIGRVLFVLAGLLLLSALFFFREFGVLAVLGIVLPAIVTIATARVIRRPS